MNTARPPNTILQPTDREALARALQFALEGSLSYLDYLKISHLASSKDRAVSRIWCELEDLLCDDLAPARPIAVDDATRQLLGRCILFLRSDQEYGWPKHPRMK